MGIGGTVGIGAVMNMAMNQVAGIDTAVTVLDRWMKSVEDAVMNDPDPAIDARDLAGAVTSATQSSSLLRTTIQNII